MREASFVKQNKEKWIGFENALDNNVLSIKNEKMYKNLGILAKTKFENKDFEDVAYFEPYYLKDFVAGEKKA